MCAANPTDLAQRHRDDGQPECEASTAQRRCPHCDALASAELQPYCDDCGAPLGPDPLLGKTVEGRYEVIRRLGAGAMGAVYEVRHLRLGKRFAMKIIGQALARAPEFAARFQQEALSSSRLEHPNCITVTDFGKTKEGQPFLVMEFLEGASLATLLGSPMQVTRALGIARKVLLGLQHAHSAGVVHRDVKPDNVMIVDAGRTSERVKVVDFGIAKLAQAGGGDAPPSQSQSRLTQAGVVFGTPDYMAPEQALGSADVDARADIYAVGVILWNMLTGRELFVAENNVALLQRKLAEDAPLLSETCPGVYSNALEQALASALARNPSDRFVSAEAFIVALDAVLASPGRGGAVGATGGGGGWQRAAAPLRTLGGAYRGWYRETGPGWKSRLRGLVAHGKGRVVLACGAGLLVVVALLLALSGDGAPPVSPLAGPPPTEKDIVAPRKGESRIDRRLKLARLLLAKRACREAVIDLSNLVRVEPKLARAHYLLGAAELCRGRTNEGLAAYRRALELEPAYRKDARVLEDAGGLLASRRRGQRLAALAFLEQAIGAPAKELLLGATTHRDRRVRSAAVAAAVRLGAGNKIDWVTTLKLDLQQLSCSEVKRRKLVERLKRLGDPRVLKILQWARGKRAGFLGYRSRYGCVRAEINAAIRELQGSAGK